MTTAAEQVRHLEQELAIERGLHDEGARRRAEAERNAVIFCRWCGHSCITLAGVLRHLEEAADGPLAKFHKEDAR